MSAEKVCRICGAPTASSDPNPICFGCQIKNTTSGGGGDTFYFDDDSSSIFDGLETRLAEALTTIKVEEEIGRGGMGVVYRAVQKKLDRTVAVKVLPPRNDADEGFAARFLTEARAMARLHHSHIVAIHDFGQTECGLSYIVMEFVKGRSLDVIMDSDKLDPVSYTDLMAQLADALAYAHGLDVVHRDMKPQNVLVDVRGQGKIADFGIAKLEGDRHVSRLTRTHQILGTPLYMAPEQTVAAHKVDHRADLYALGVMVYHGLTGLFPSTQFSPPSDAADIDLRLDAVCESLLENNPEDRADSAEAIARSFREIARTWKPRSEKRSFIDRMFGR